MADNVVFRNLKIREEKGTYYKPPKPPKPKGDSNTPSPPPDNDPNIWSDDTPKPKEDVGVTVTGYRLVNCTGPGSIDSDGNQLVALFVYLSDGNTRQVTQCMPAGKGAGYDMEF
jgi:hypothetical protein